MARPIKETPILKGKESKEFLKQLEENENKKVEFSFRRFEKKLQKRIIDEAPKW
jgi:hypothetical protein